jgi:hypothetical protein
VGVGLLIVAAIGIAIYFLALPRGRKAEELAAEHAVLHHAAGPDSSPA